ncbi:Alpha/beta hydrolase family [Trypanosoma brucei equiperdum]|uniref:Alpha/beta hydrolase family n=1 Tax=Trypanosoma brucei equiperdum TaxID=630700 RepID=A0A3L6L775_9TRYP|nr:Alpha/beta hydrolase family [Trypanosoma brucei equiperdum]
MTSLKEKVLFLLLHTLIHILVIHFWNVVRTLVDGIFGKRRRRSRGVIEVVAHGNTSKVFFSLDKVEKLFYLSPPYDGRINTVLCALRPNWPISYTREVVNGVDDNPICLDWLIADTSERDARGILIIVPGLASWSQTNYIQRCVLLAHRYGIHCCVFNCKGLGDTPLTTPRMISASWTGDLHKTFSTALSREALSRKFGTAANNIWGAGFSLGGVIMSKFLKECALQGVKSQPLDAALIINSPLDMEETSRTLNEPQNAMYQRKMISNVIQFVTKHIDVLKNVKEIDLKEHDNDILKFMKSLRSLQEFDVHINAPHNGFATVKDFYDAVNVFTSLRHCNIPVLCLVAEDDPVIGSLPSNAFDDVASCNKLVAFVKFPYGGHLGFCRSPMEEWNGEPSVMEMFICDLISSHKHMEEMKEPTEGICLY